MTRQIGRLAGPARRAMYIETVKQPSEELWEAFRRLVPQLTTNHPPPGREDLTALLESGASTLVVARSPTGQDRIVGAACLAIYRVPTGVRAVIEDVVVESAARRQGIGEALVRRLLEIAREMGLEGVALTSNPRRVSANRLYVRLGFKLRETNSYYYRF